MDYRLDQPTPIRRGEELDTARLEAYLLEQLPEAEGPLLVQQFPSGFSNLTYLLRLGDQQLVLRRPPFGANIKTAHDMGREYTILSRLIGNFDLAPRPLLYTDRTDVIGAPFYVMERVEGVILRATMSVEQAPPPPVMRQIAGNFVDVLAALHAVDYEAAGLADFGRPEGYVERQVTGWAQRYERAKTDDIPALEQTARWLADHRPPESDAAIIHNDYKYDNIVLAAADLTHIKAVLDWEMATLGDPLMDLGTTLGYWFTAEDPDFIRRLQLNPSAWPGNPDRTELAESYARRSGRSLDHLVFYYVFGLFKIAVIAQQIYTRFRQGHSQDPRFGALIHAVRGLGMMATRAVEKKRVDELF